MHFKEKPNNQTVVNQNIQKQSQDSQLVSPVLQKILIYEYLPEGTTRASVEEVEKMLQRLVLPGRYKIEKVTGQYLREADWEKETLLLVIPGGRARVNYKNIGEAGNKKIVSFVKLGGSYLGICGGGYYGSAKTVFERGGPLEVLDEGPLYFYPGTAEGPVYGLGKFQYQSEAGTQLSKVSFNFSAGNHENVIMYFNGGCYFHGDKSGKIEILGKFNDIEATPAAIVECKVGQGRAILSGVHFEFSDSARNLQNPKFEKIKQELRSTQTQRDTVLGDVLGRLGVMTKALNLDNRLAISITALPKAGLLSSPGSEVAATHKKLTELPEAPVLLRSSL